MYICKYVSVGAILYDINTKHECECAYERRFLDKKGVWPGALAANLRGRNGTPRGEGNNQKYSTKELVQIKTTS